MTTKKISFRVQYYETDQMQYSHHSNYAKYFETARIEYLRSLGISYKSMENDGIMLPVVNLNIDFKKPAKYDDLLIIETCLKEKPGVKITFVYTVYNEAKELLTKGESTLVFVDMKKNKPMRCPEPILKAILEA